MNNIVPPAFSVTAQLQSADKSRIVQCCLLNERLLHKKLFHLQKSKFQFLNDKSFDFIIKYISIHL
jgi:hypothetical protein